MFSGKVGHTVAGETDCAKPLALAPMGW